MSLESAAPDLGRSVNALAVDAGDLTALVTGLRKLSTALLMGVEPCLNWASRAAFSRAAADVLTGWMATCAARPELLAPADDRTLELATVDFDRYLRVHWRAAHARAWSAPVSGRLLSATRAA